MRARRGVGLALAALLAAVLGLGLSGCGSSGGGGYQVRAIFDDAGNVIAGEDVKIAGVKVGSVASLSVTPAQKAAVVLDITNPGFQDFRTDASCTVRPQALIGEMFVECAPTQPRPVGVPEPPPLPVIRNGCGAGQHYLPVTNTSSPVGLDLIGDVARLPYTQRLSIIINELGAGLAGNGTALEQVVQRATPTLAALDRVLAILATRTTRSRGWPPSPTRSSRRWPPPRTDRRLHREVEHGGHRAGQHRVALGQVLAKLPGFLDALTPTLRELCGARRPGQSGARQPRRRGAGRQRVTENLAPLSNGRPAYLAASARPHSPASPRSGGAAGGDVAATSLGTAAQPFAKNAAALLRASQKQNGLKDILDFIFRGSLACNGYDPTGTSCGPTG